MSRELREHRIEGFLSTLAICAGVAVALIGAYFLLGWLTGRMTNAGLHTITIKTNASLCLLLCGSALALAVVAEPSPARIWTARTLATLSFVIGGLTFLEHLFALDFGIDQLLARESAGAVGILHPNRMGPPGAICATIGGAAILLLLLKRPAARAVQTLGLMLSLIALLGMIGYLYGVPGLYGAAKYTGIAWQTTIALFILGIGILCSRPNEGLMAPVTALDPAGVATRHLLLPAIFLPVLLGWLHLKGEALGWYEHQFGTSLLVISWIIIFSCLVYRTGIRLGSLAAAKEKAVNELKQTQALLLEAERLSHTGAWEWDLRSDRWTFSNEWLSIHGSEARNLPPDALLGIAHPEDRPAIRQAFEDLRQGLAPYRMEHRIIKQDDGAIRTVKAQGQFIKDASGTVVRVYGFVQDVTEQKQAEQELHLQRQLLESVVQHLPAGLMIVEGKDLRVMMVNPAFAIFAPGKDMVGRTLAEVWPEVQPALDDIFHQVLETGEPYVAVDAPVNIRTSAENPLESRYFTWSLHRVLLPGNRGYGLLNTAWETTARKRTEEALRDSEEKFRAVFQHAAVGMGRVAFTDARWIDVNDAFCQMLGYSADEMRATPWPEMTHPEDVDLDLVPFREMAAGNLDSYRVEKRFIHKDGHHVWVRLTLSVVLDREGRPDYEIAVIEDITSRKHAEEHLFRAKEELETRVRERTRELEQAYENLTRETEERIAAVEGLRKNEQLLIQQSRLAAMGEMLGNIAHQWRQPLNILALLVQQLLLSMEVGELTREALEAEVAKAMRLILHMSQTINDFRDFLQEEKEKRPFSLNQAVLTTISLFEATLKSSDATLEVNQTVELFISGHRNEFCQVLMNIITNARDAFRERKIPSPKIVISLFPEGDKAVVTITDNAGGIPDAIIGKIFDPYFTTKGPDKGTGIGLFMSKNIIEKSMHGSLTVQNTEAGAQFRIELEA